MAVANQVPTNQVPIDKTPTKKVPTNKTPVKKAPINKTPVKKVLINRVPTKIPGFDKLIQGGFVQNSVILVCGGPGTGKTIFGLHFLYNGAQLGDTGLFVSFDETCDKIFEDAKAIKIDLEKMKNKGKLYFCDIEPFKKPNFESEIFEIIKEKKVTRVFIDSISHFTMAFSTDYFNLRRKITSFVKKLTNLGVTALITSEAVGNNQIDSSTSITREGILEFLADSLMTFHNSGIGGGGDRAIRILKMRRTNHIKQPISIEISSNGLKVLKELL